MESTFQFWRTQSFRIADLCPYLESRQNLLPDETGRNGGVMKVLVIAASALALGLVGDGGSLAEANERACFFNGGVPGAPLLCLETRQGGGDVFDFRLCWEGGRFNGDVQMTLRTDLWSSPTYVEDVASSCGSWIGVDMSTLPCDAVSHVRGDVRLPSGHAARTGEIRILKDCR